jgi:hypothetical protein
LAARDDLNLTAAFDFARDALKSLILVNGGAVIALLTFYGSILGKDSHALPVGARCFAFCGLIGFSIGLLMAILASLFAYLTQLTWGKAVEDESQREKSADTWHLVSMGASLASAFSFGIGVVLTGIALFNWSS